MPTRDRAKLRKYNRDLYARRRAADKCVICLGPANGHARCAECAHYVKRKEAACAAL